jgi:copper transport protein
MDRRPALALVGCIVALLAVLAGARSPHPAYAQTPPPTIDPADGAQLSVSPSEIRVQFGEAVGFGLVGFVITGADGTSTPIPAEQVSQTADGLGAVATIATPLPEGQYTVTVTAGTTQSTSTFSVAPPVTTTTAPEDTDTDPPVASQLPSPFPGVVRWASLGALSLLTGSLLVMGVTFPPLQRDVRARRLLMTGYGAMVLTAALAVVDASDRLDTTEGRAIIARLALTVLLPVAIVGGGRVIESAEVALGGLVIVAIAATFALAGHGWNQRWPVAGVIADTLHTLAMAAWLGGAVVVATIVLGRFRTNEAATAGRRFAAVNALAIPVLVVTGLFQAVRLVGSPADLFGTTHGRWVLVKGLVAAVALVSASATGRRLRVLRSERGAFVIRQAMGTQILLASGVLAIAALLVVTVPATQPPPEVPEPELPVTTVVARSESVELVVQVTPAAVGDNAIVATPSETSQEVTSLSMQALLGEQVVTVELTREDDAFVAPVVTFPSAGTWTLRFLVPNRDPIGGALVITDTPATTTTTTTPG